MATGATPTAKVHAGSFLAASAFWGDNPDGAAFGVGLFLTAVMTKSSQSSARDVNGASGDAHLLSL